MNPPRVNRNWFGGAAVSFCLPDLLISHLQTPCARPQAYPPNNQLTTPSSPVTPSHAPLFHKCLGTWHRYQTGAAPPIIQLKSSAPLKPEAVHSPVCLPVIAASAFHAVSLLITACTLHCVWCARPPLRMTDLFFFSELLSDFCPQTPPPPRGGVGPMGVPDLGLNWGAKKSFKTAEISQKNL